MDKTIIIFITIQFVNVLLSTLKSIITVNGSKETAAVINAISYTFGAVITKLITKQNFAVIVTITFLSNLIGVYLAKVIVEKTKKERLWTITATVRGINKNSLEQSLQFRGIQYTLIPCENDRYLFNIYSKSKGESLIIKEILGGHKSKYNIVENMIPAL